MTLKSYLSSTRRKRYSSTYSRPKSLAPSSNRRVQYNRCRLSRITFTMSAAEQLVCNLRLFKCGTTDNQAAVSDEIAFVSSSNSEKEMPFSSAFLRISISRLRTESRVGMSTPRSPINFLIQTESDSSHILRSSRSVLAGTP